MALTHRERIKRERERKKRQAATEAKNTKIADESKRIDNNIERMKSQEYKRAQEAILRKKFRSDARQEIEEKVFEHLIGAQVPTEEKDQPKEERQSRDFEYDARDYVAPSINDCPKGSREQRTKYDDLRFKHHKTNRFNDDRVSDYIAIMMEYFDVEPYRQEVETIMTKGGTMTSKPVTKANDLPLFSEFGFKAGLTKSDIEELKSRSERFAHAYELCVEKQEQVLVTNMLMGLYGPQASTFTAKNLLGWRNDSQIEMTADFDINQVMQDVQKSNNDEDFMGQKRELRIA